MKGVNIRLTAKWSDYEAGDIVCVSPAKAANMIAKGYGHEDKSAEAAEIAHLDKPNLEIPHRRPGRRPRAETTTAEPKAEGAETAEKTPQVGSKSQTGKGGE